MPIPISIPHRTRLLLMLACVCALPLLGTQAQAQDEDQDEEQDQLRVGVCQRDITPISPNLASAYEAAFGGAAVVNHTDPIFMAGFSEAIGS